jgi:prepilin-type N-terminal cleavage/methylation domain-containing protein
MENCSVKYNKPQVRPLGHSENGFSLMEVLIVVAMMLVIAAAALPMLNGYVRSYSLVSDARAIAGQMALARMRSANGFSLGQLDFNLANGTFQVKICSKVGSTWGFNPDTSSPPISLSKSFGAQDSFSFGSITTPAGNQTTLAQPNTAVTFNSRGIPVSGAACNGTAGSGTPTGNYAVYLTDNASKPSYVAVTVNVSSKITIWRWNASTLTWTEL